MRALFLCVLLSGCAAQHDLTRLQLDARNLDRPGLAPLTHRFLAGAALLPHVAKRRVQGQTYDEEYYYNTRYFSGLTYVRPMEILARYGITSLDKKRVIDFGYGGIAQLMLFARMGADVTGVDIDKVTAELYRDAQGKVGDGTLRIVCGYFPSDANVKAQVGEGYDLFIAKNTLKRGFIHPDQEADPRTQLKLGVDDETFVRTLFDLLRPGGHVLIYNITPAQAPYGAKFIPWADGRSPYPRVLYEQVGFKVLAFETDDSAGVREMAHTLGWDTEDKQDLEHDLFGQYTLLEKP